MRPIASFILCIAFGVMDPSGVMNRFVMKPYPIDFCQSTIGTWLGIVLLSAMLSPHAVVGCGDYVLVNGIPLHAASFDYQVSLGSDPLPSPLKLPCQGPGCQGKPPSQSGATVAVNGSSPRGIAWSEVTEELSDSHADNSICCIESRPRVLSPTFSIWRPPQ
jgi:hypothetical protein